jgi:hypothetical protein
VVHRKVRNLCPFYWKQLFLICSRLFYRTDIEFPLHIKCQLKIYCVRESLQNLVTTEVSHCTFYVLFLCMSFWEERALSSCQLRNPRQLFEPFSFGEKKTHANAYLWLLYPYLLCIKISLFEQEGRSLQFGCRNSKRDLSGLIAFPLRNEFVINDATHSANNQTDNQFL